MTVYVDALQPCLPTRRWPYAQSCHLIADGLIELHEFAERIDLKHEWFQPGSHPHYDLTKNKRRIARLNGAVVADRATVVRVLREWRERGRKR